MRDSHRLSEDASVRVLEGNHITEHDGVRWHARAVLRKYHGDIAEVRSPWLRMLPRKLRQKVLAVHEAAWFAARRPYEVVSWDGNLLMYGGASCLWQCLIGNGTGTAAQTLTYFNNGNAYLGVGDSTTAEAATQTDLQASSNKLRKAMDATYPTHTDATTSGAASISYRSTFASSDANFAWQEWATFNGSSGGRMLNRKVQSLGTKVSGTSWQLTVTLTLA